MRDLSLWLFLAVALVQIAVPLGMITSAEQVIGKGAAFKFKTRPVDPNDPFRGKFLVLGFEADSYISYEQLSWQKGQEVFVHLETGTDGFARVAFLSQEQPPEKANTYVKASVQRSFTVDSGRKVLIDYPFDRFFVEETKAPKLEQVYRELNREEGTLVYALVNVRNGQAVLQDLMVNGRSLLELVD